MSDEIIVLGGNGLVGSEFLYKKIRRVEADLTDVKQVDKLFEKYKPKVVINCAGYVGGIQANMDFQWSFFKKNVLINMNVIETAMFHKVPNVISFLSTCIFPTELSNTKALEESDLHEGEPHKSNYPYAYAKRMTQVMSEIANDMGFNYSCITPCNIYGFNDNYDLHTSHIIPALIHKFYLAYIKSINTNTKTFVEVWGTGEPEREFIFAKDIVNIINQMIHKNLHFKNLIVAPKESIKIKDLVATIDSIFHKIFSYCNPQVEYYFNSEKPDGQIRKNTNTDLLNKNFPNINLTPLHEGLQLTIEHFISEYENDKNLKL